MTTRLVTTVSVLVCLALLVFHSTAQISTPHQTPDTLGLDQGYLEFATRDLTLKLVKSSLTAAGLVPNTSSSFDFTPADRLDKRAANGLHHLGDLTLRLRIVNSKQWNDYDTSAERKPVTPLPMPQGTIASADLSPTLPADIPLQIVRSWVVDNKNLVLRFDIKNRINSTVEIGSLGIPVIFNNMLTDRSLEQSHERCSFSDPYIGLDAGYLQVTRLNGKGPTLLVVPEKNTPFEAYQTLNEPVRPSQTFEGAFSWMVHSRAHAENEWKGASQWNGPTSTILAPGETKTFGLRFLVSDQIRNIETTLRANQRPVAVGLPGYVLPLDIEAQLFLSSNRKVSSVRVEPAGAIKISPLAAENGWSHFRLRGRTWGRARLAFRYDDGSRQAIHYYVIKPAAQAVSDLGNFLLTKQWYVNPADPFRRSPSVMSYDRDRNGIVTQDSRVWIAGLGDEGGSGSWLAAAMKEFGQPEKREIEKYQEFVDQVLWGGLQYKEGDNKYGVRKSLFYYSPAEVPGFEYDHNLNWTTWTSWKKPDAESVGRGYNYPHVIAAYWALYRLARNHQGLVTKHSWDWYLNQAYETTHFMFSRKADGKRRVDYVELGLMEGDIILHLLSDLKLEGWNRKASEVESLMRERADRWRAEAYPFASEMAWDSTGQEEVYAWSEYFGFHDKAQVSLDSIIGYMPTIPHWGYNGNARRYWDFLYGGKIRRIERQLHHYGSGLNAIPVLSYYRQHPDDFYLLRVGYGGTMGALTNIDQDGFASVAFHSFPSTLRWDPYSGDYGPNFFGHALNTATYVVKHPEFGWQTFGGNLRQTGDWITVKPLDSFRMRVYIAHLGLWLTLDSGNFETVAFNTRTRMVRIIFKPATESTPVARLRIEQPAKIPGVGTYKPSRSFVKERDAYTIRLSKELTSLELRDW